MNKQKRSRGRPRLPDAPTAAPPPTTRLSSRLLPPAELEARRLYERQAKRRQRERTRQQRANPQGLKPGQDGLQLMRDQLAEARAAQLRLEADLALVSQRRTAELRELYRLRRQLGLPNEDDRA